MNEKEMYEECPNDIKTWCKSLEHKCTLECLAKWKEHYANFGVAYPLTEKEFPLAKPKFLRRQYTLSGWVRLIKCGLDENNEREKQILGRMWEDKNYDAKIRKEFDEWIAQEPAICISPWYTIGKLATPVEAARDEWAEMSEDKLRKLHNKAIRQQGKYKGRGKEKRRE